MTEALGQFKQILVNLANDIGKIAAIRNSTQYSNVNYFGAFDQAVEVLSTLSSSDFKLPHVVEQSSNSNPFGTTNNIVTRSFGNDIYTFSFAGGNVVMIRSLDGGSTWSFSETQLNEPAGIQTVGFAFPLDIVKINGTVYFALTYEDTNLLTYNVAFITWGYSGNILHYGADIPSLDHVYAGYYDPITDDYTYHIYGTDNKYYPEVYDGSSSPTKGSEIAGLVAPASFDINKQQYRIQGRYELQIDEDHFYFRILGASSWQQKIASGTSTLALGWGFDKDGNLILYWIFWRDVIFKIFERGKIERIQDTSFDAFTGFGADIYEAWISTGDGILQFQPSQERLKNNNALAIDFRSHPIDYEGGKATVIDTSLGTIFEKDDYAIFFKDFLRYQLKNVQQYYLWEDNYKGTPPIPGVEDWGSPDEEELDNFTGTATLSIIDEWEDHTEPMKMVATAGQNLVYAFTGNTNVDIDIWLYFLETNISHVIDLTNLSSQIGVGIDFDATGNVDLRSTSDGTIPNVTTYSANIWTHVKLSFKALGRTEVFINGSSVGFWTDTGNYTIINLTYELVSATTAYLDSFLLSINGAPPGSPNLFREVYDYNGKPLIPGIINWGNEIDFNFTGWDITIDSVKVITYVDKHFNAVYAQPTGNQRMTYDLGNFLSTEIFEFWIKPEFTNKYISINIKNSSSGLACVIFRFFTDGKIDFIGATVASDIFTYYSQWYHIRIEANQNATSSLFVNGDLVATVLGANHSFDQLVFEPVTADANFWLDSVAFATNGYPPVFSANLFPLDTKQIHEAIVTNVGQPENGERTIKFETRTAQDLSRPVTLDILQQTVTAIAVLLEAGNENAKISVSGASGTLYDFPWKQQPLDECLTELANIDGLNWDILKTRDQNIILDDYQNIDPMAYDYKHWAGVQQWGDHIFPLLTIEQGWANLSGPNCFVEIVEKIDGHGEVLCLNDQSILERIDLRFDFTAQTSGNIEHYIHTTDSTKTFQFNWADGFTVAIDFQITGGNLQYYKGGVGWITIQAITNNQWYHLRIKNINTVTDTFDLWFEGTEIEANVSFENIVTEIDKFRCVTSTGSSGYQVNIDAIGLSWDGYKAGSNKNYNDKFADIVKEDNPQTASVIEVLGGLKPDGTRYSATETITDVEGTTHSTTNPSFGQAECDAMAIALKTQKSVEVLQVRGTFGPGKPFQSGYRTLFSYPFDPVNIKTQFLAIIQKVVYEAVTGKNEFLFSDAIIRSSKGDSGITTRGNQQLINALHINSSESSANGSGNAKWISCPFELEDQIGKVQLSDGISNVDATNSELVFDVPLTTTNGSLKLYIVGVRVVLTDADVSNYISRVKILGISDSARVIDKDLNPPTVAWNSTGKHEQLFTAVDFSSRNDVKVQIRIVVGTANNLDIGTLQIKYYYDT